MPLLKILQQTTPIGYVSAEFADKMKLVDDKITISPSQHFKKQTQEQVFVCLLLTFVWTETEILQWVPQLSSICPMGQHNYQLIPITQLALFFYVRGLPLGQLGYE